MKKLNLVITLVLLSALFLVGLASAASPTVTLNLPAASTRISGSALELNASLSAASDGSGNFTCLFYAYSTLTANNTWTFLGSAENTTNSDANITSFDSAVLEDANNYIFNVTCINDTETFVDDLNTGIIVNNTIPTAVSSTPISYSVIVDATTQTFTGTVTDSKTTSCTYTIGRGGTTTESADTYTGTGDYSGSTCTFTKTFSDQNDNGN